MNKPATTINTTANNFFMIPSSVVDGYLDLL